MSPIQSIARRVLTAFGMLSVFLMIIAISGSKPVGKSTLLPAATTPEPVVGVAPKEGNLDHLAVWVNAARQTFATVRDYQCSFTKRERVDGALHEELTAALKVRTRPFSVHLKFTAPRSASGKEASFVQGRNEGKMRAKAGGGLGLVGFVTIDPRDPKAMRGTRHAITEAGIGHLIEQLAQATAKTPGVIRPGLTVVVSEYLVATRACVRFDINDPTADGVANQPKTVVYFDKETNLPVRYEAYDQRGDLVEAFGYTSLKFNVGLTDAAFP